VTVPRSTYRLQLTEGFGFREAATQACAYLAELGVSHAYLSPVLQAAPGSTHGYDVADPTRLSAELGGDEGFSALVAGLRHHGLGVVLDIVPNHLGLVSPANRWWWDVLRHGPDSAYAGHFDIRWRARGGGPPQVLVPHLGQPLEDELAAGDALHLQHHTDADDADDDPEAGYGICYHEHRWPVRPGSLARIGLDPSDIGATLRAVRADPGRLFALLLDQHYHLVHWRRANEDLNYRRFFDVTTLGGVRVEEASVFDDVHRRVLELVASGQVDGLRIDHPDGLRDPAGYLQRLRAAAPGAWIVVEKILEPGEPPRQDWPIDGTVGYEFAELVLGLFIDPSSAPVLSGLYQQLTGQPDDYDAVVDAAKRQVVRSLFGSERTGLLDALERIAETAGVVAGRDTLDAAMLELLVAFPVYRTYVRADDGVVEDVDRAIIHRATARARSNRPHLDEALDLLREVLTLEQGGERAADLVMRFQQLTGPVMAKGVEDTVFYRYLRFVAANEVGGDPQHLGTSVAAFHDAGRRRQRDWPAAMLTTSTHDTKRSEDVRARLAVLSELPELWVRAVEEWHDLAGAHRGARGPSPAHEYLTFQTLVGAWPISADRLVAYLLKAAREGKQETDWITPDAAYEADLEAFVRGLLSDQAFLGSLATVLDAVVEPGRLTSLSQTLLKCTFPGVPDLYQGTELWDLSLVDPDNRRPIDLARRHQLLSEVTRDRIHPVDLLARMEDGVPKLRVVHRALQLRRDRPEAFGADGSYEPLHPVGAREDHLVAFLRGGEVAVIAPRLVVGLGGRFLDWDWGDTSITLPEGRWRCVLSGQVQDGGRAAPLAELLAAFPLALLARDPAA
jgi:(1->4)-alpha-D-glucan 1-alpha-D-glucosylmutase